MSGSLERKPGAEVWAVPGPSEVAQQGPMTTNDDHQTLDPTDPDQQR